MLSAPTGQLHYITERRYSLYEKFEELLKENNVNPYQVAKATGIVQSTFYDWKAGRYTPKVDKLQKIAEYFDVPITYFIE